MNWNVPESEGAYPTFPEDATEDMKKKEISEFVKRKNGIKHTAVLAVQSIKCVRLCCLG